MLVHRALARHRVRLRPDRCCVSRDEFTCLQVVIRAECLEASMRAIHRVDTKVRKVRVDIE
jgi:hypothetical protein